MTTTGFWKPPSCGFAASTGGSSTAATAASGVLPIAAHRTQILHALETLGVVVLVGETECDKSTQLPRYLHENGWSDDDHEIICTQPRRRTGKEMMQGTTSSSSSSGRRPVVGYSVRFASTYVPGVTKIRYVTDGWLLRETTLLDPLLRRAHERSVNTELLLGAAKKIRRARPELRVVVCSAVGRRGEFFVGGAKRRSRRMTGGRDRTATAAATRRRRRRGIRRPIGRRSLVGGRRTTTNTATRDGRELTRDLTDGTIISVDGRQHPVDVMYANEPVALRILEEGKMTGTYSASSPPGRRSTPPSKWPRTRSRRRRRRRPQLTSHPAADVDATQGTTRRACPVQLPPAGARSLVFLPRSDDEIREGKRRIIFATNVCRGERDRAERRARRRLRLRQDAVLRPAFGFDRLIICPISRASAEAARGEGGRVRRGGVTGCTPRTTTTTSLEAETAPERCPTAWRACTRWAQSASSAELTALGNEMVYFPTDPRTSRMLLASLDMERREDRLDDLFHQPARNDSGGRTTAPWPTSSTEALITSSVHLFDLVDHSGKMLSEDECRDRFVNRAALVRALDVRDQLARFVGRRRFGGGARWFGAKLEIVGSASLRPRQAERAIRKCVCAGYFTNVARLGGGRYYSLRGNYAVSVVKKSTAEEEATAASSSAAAATSATAAADDDNMWGNALAAPPPPTSSSSAASVAAAGGCRHRRGNDAACMPLYSSLPEMIVQSLAFLPRDDEIYGQD
ncbi:hypothetical protein ACHAW5_000387 [Stephanodiscus triporus]|uniref:Uncharacterized protein n=1 Tax=Stephanodiscus triporus TaxID=2934178 RepID=A0ABD3NDY5_9STRA